MVNKNTVAARINVGVLCPTCGSVMASNTTYVKCCGIRCKTNKVRYKLPTVELQIIKR